MPIVVCSYCKFFSENYDEVVKHEKTCPDNPDNKTEEEDENKSENENNNNS